MSKKADRAIEAMRAALADPPEWIEIKSRRAQPFVSGWITLERAMAIGTEDENKALVGGFNFYKRAKPGETETGAATPSAVKQAFESVMVMFGDAIVREEYDDLMAVAELLEHQRNRRFVDKIGRWVLPLFDAPDAPPELISRYRELLQEHLPDELRQFYPRAARLSPKRIAEALDRGRSFEGTLAWLGAFGEVATNGGEEGPKQKRLYGTFHNLIHYRDKRASERRTKT